MKSTLTTNFKTKLGLLWALFWHICLGDWIQRENQATFKEQYPLANGASMSQPCTTNKCKYWAETGMTGWDHTETWYQACIINTEKEGTESISSTTQ